MKSTKLPKAKAIAFYLPQFHAIPENDEWWGKGFTDWDNVRKAKPLFDGHYQPRVPLDDNYYDLSKTENIKWQVDLAKSYGVYGFCHYHYWFEGKQLLETPTNLFLKEKSLDMPFCLAWANETWSRQWDGREHDTLQKQTHTPDPKLWKQHFDYLIQAWTDERAIRVDDRPVFLIYRPDKIDAIADMFDCWRTEAKKHGLDGIYLVAVKRGEFSDNSNREHFDAVVHFQPFEATYRYMRQGNSLRKQVFSIALKYLPDLMKDLSATVFTRLGRQIIFDYDKVWAEIIKAAQRADVNTFPGAFIDWDNTARYGARARLFQGANPERFEYWLNQLVECVDKGPQLEPFIFVNAWNEWAEGTMLEPDKRYGYGYLEALQRCIY